MKFCALLVLCLLPLQEPNKQPETVALVFGPEPSRIEIVKTEEAEAEYQVLSTKLKAGTLTEQEAKTFAALTQALGTQVPHVNSTRERLDWEIRRGVRKPLQPPEPKEVIH